MKRETAITIAGVCAIAVFTLTLGYMLGGETVDPNPTLQATLDQSEVRRKQAADSVAMLLERITERDTLNAQLMRLYLTEASKKADIAAHYEPINRILATADTRVLHRITDSLRTRYRSDRDRYRALLDTGGLSLLHDPGNP